MAMTKLPVTALDQYGNALQGASVYVYTAGTSTTVTLYEDDETTTKTNPMTTDTSGFCEAMVANGTYDIFVVKNTAYRRIKKVAL